MSGLRNKVIVITGSANGLGKALAKEFFSQGCHLALVDIDAEGLESIESVLSSATQKVSIHVADVSNEEEIISARQEIIRKHGQVDMLINNAAISNSRPFDQVDLKEYRQLFEVNFWGMVLCTKHFLPGLKKQHASRLVNIISGFALMGFPGKTTYASSKSAVMGFTNSLRTELSGTTVSVCLVIPPPLDTNIVFNGEHIDDDKKANEINFIKRHSIPIDRVTKRIVSKIKAGKYRIITGKMTFWADLAARLFPTTIHTLIAKNKKRIDFI